MGTFAPCFCARAVEYSRTLLLCARRKTRHCLILHPPFAIKMFYVFLTNYNVEVIFYKYHKKCVHRNFYVCFTKFGTLSKYWKMGAGQIFSSPQNISCLLQCYHAERRDGQFASGDFFTRAAAVIIVTDDR